MSSNQIHNKNLSLNKDQSTQLRVSFSERTRNDYAPTLLKIPGPDLNNSFNDQGNLQEKSRIRDEFLSSLSFFTLRTLPNNSLILSSSMMLVASVFPFRVGRFSSRRARSQILFPLKPLSQFPPQLHFNLGLSLT